MKIRRWLTLACALFASGCGRKLTYADDVDTAALDTAYKCSGSPSGDRAHACRIIADFASAGPFDVPPQKPLETWFGRKVCADKVDLPDQLDFGQIHLAPGVGKADWPDDVKTEPARDLTYGAQFIGTSVGSIAPASQRAEYQKAIAAAEKGNTPNFDNLADFDKDRMNRFWESVKRPPVKSDFQRLVKSNGKSVLGVPYTSDAKQKPSAAYFLRGKDDRMLVVYPSPQAPCVAELWKIHTE
jgi:hypothetical protein